VEQPGNARLAARRCGPIGVRRPPSPPKGLPQTTSARRRSAGQQTGAARGPGQRQRS